jgi:Zn-dependent M28 family amino/carboxypeptidase
LIKGFKTTTIIQQFIISWLFLGLVACASEQAIPTVVPEADKDRYIADVTFIAQAPRTSIDPHHQVVQDLCAERLSELGYEVERHDFGNGVNVIGRLTGTTYPDEIVIVSAHYDTIPKSNGADDNASGVAAVLETARLLADEEHERTLLIACWDQEEPALYGSYVYANRERERNTDIKVVYVYDEIGSSDDRPDSQQFPAGFEFLYPAAAKKLRENQHRANFVLLIFDQQAGNWAHTIAAQAEKVGLPSIELDVNLDEDVPTDLKGSDHASFWRRGYPAIEINDTAGYRNPYKHTKLDTVDTLDHDFAVKIISAVVSSVRTALESSE